MAIDLNTAKILVSARRAGAEFTRTLTLGKQWLWIDLNRKSVRSLFLQYGLLAPDIDIDLTNSDAFFSLLGAQKVDALDASNYEDASIIHDLNDPLPPSLRAQYDLVFDGGTLEHVFNFPVAIRNAMEAVRIGGHLLLHTPTNNYCGHGFYQFSPELFYRVLTQENGFKIERMIAYSIFPGSKWYEVADPAQSRCRVEIRYDPHRVILLVLAKRTHEAEIFKTKPQQSDYVAAWQQPAQQIAAWRPAQSVITSQTFTARLVNSWRSGWLPYALALRWLALFKCHALANSLQNRRVSRKFQPELFRPVDS